MGARRTFGFLGGATGAAIVCACLYEVPDVVSPDDGGADDGAPETNSTDSGDAGDAPAPDVAPPPPPDSGLEAGTEPFGAPCRANGECASGLCYDFGGLTGTRCTLKCDGPNPPCPLGPLTCSGGVCQMD
jgi:hypothetical protein